MKLESQVCSLGLAQKLKYLNVKQESMFYWMEYTKKTTGEKEWDINSKGMKQSAWNLLGQSKSGISWKSDWEGMCSAFTVAELGEMLPKRLNVKVVNLPSKTDDDKWFFTIPDTNHAEMSDTEADARAKMLIYLLENNLMTP